MFSKYFFFESDEDISSLLSGKYLRLYQVLNFSRMGEDTDLGKTGVQSQRRGELNSRGK